MKINELTSINSNYLSQAVYRNFIKEQSDRFHLLEGKKCETGTMFFCNTYLEAKFLMAIEKGVALYRDDCSDSGKFVVCTEKEFNSKDFEK